MNTMEVTMPEAKEIHKISDYARKAMDRQAMIHYVGAHIILDNRLHEVVSTKIFKSLNGGSKYTAILWIANKDYWISTSGWAGGWGYHKSSAALQDAICNGGIKISESINGRGDEAMSIAIKAIAQALYPKENIYTKVVFG